MSVIFGRPSPQYLELKDTDLCLNHEELGIDIETRIFEPIPQTELPTYPHANVFERETLADLLMAHDFGDAAERRKLLLELATQECLDDEKQFKIVMLLSKDEEVPQHIRDSVLKKDFEDDELAEEGLADEGLADEGGEGVLENDQKLLALSRMDTKTQMALLAHHDSAVGPDALGRKAIRKESSMDPLLMKLVNQKEQEVEDVRLEGDVPKAESEPEFRAKTEAELQQIMSEEPSNAPVEEGQSMISTPGLPADHLSELPADSSMPLFPEGSTDPEDFVLVPNQDPDIPNCAQIDTPLFVETPPEKAFVEEADLHLSMVISPNEAPSEQKPADPDIDDEELKVSAADASLGGAVLSEQQSLGGEVLSSRPAEETELEPRALEITESEPSAPALPEMDFVEITNPDNPFLSGTPYDNPANPFIGAEPATNPFEMNNPFLNSAVQDVNHHGVTEETFDMIDSIIFDKPLIAKPASPKAEPLVKNTRFVEPMVMPVVEMEVAAGAKRVPESPSINEPEVVKKRSRMKTQTELDMLMDDSESEPPQQKQPAFALNSQLSASSPIVRERLTSNNELDMLMHDSYKPPEVITRANYQPVEPQLVSTMTEEQRARSRLPTMAQFEMYQQNHTQQNNTQFKMSAEEQRRARLPTVDQIAMISQLNPSPVVQHQPAQPQPVRDLTQEEKDLSRLSTEEQMKLFQMASEVNQTHVHKTLPSQAPVVPSAKSEPEPVFTVKELERLNSAEQLSVALAASEQTAAKPRFQHHMVDPSTMYEHQKNNELTPQQQMAFAMEVSVAEQQQQQQPPRQSVPLYPKLDFKKQSPAARPLEPPVVSEENLKRLLEADQLKMALEISVVVEKERRASQTGRTGLVSTMTCVGDQKQQQQPDLSALTEEEQLFWVMNQSANDEKRRLSQVSQQVPPNARIRGKSKEETKLMKMSEEEQLEYIMNMTADTVVKKQEVDLGPLPEGWEEMVDKKTGKKYWVDHRERKSSWTDPRTKRKKQSVDSRKFMICVELPGGNPLVLDIAPEKDTYWSLFEQLSRQHGFQGNKTLTFRHNGKVVDMEKYGHTLAQHGVNKGDTITVE